MQRAAGKQLWCILRPKRAGKFRTRHHAGMELVTRRLAVKPLSKFRETLTKQGLVATAAKPGKDGDFRTSREQKGCPRYSRERTSSGRMRKPEMKGADVIDMICRQGWHL
jgi:hypothetical protein